MPTTLYYNHPGDNVIADATLTVAAGTIDPLYPLVNLSDCNPALPATFTTAQARIVFDWGTPVTIAFVAVIQHNLTVAARWEAHSANTWTAPSLSEAFDVADLQADGYRTNLWQDVRAVTGAGAYRYGSLVVDTDNDAPISLGEIWIGTVVREVPCYLANPGIGRSDEAPGRSSFVTRGGVEWVHASIGRRRTLTAQFVSTDETLAALRDWNLSCGGRDQPTIVVPITPDSTDVWLVRWNADWSYQTVLQHYQRVNVGWTELARGPAI